MSYFNNFNNVNKLLIISLKLIFTQKTSNSIKIFIFLYILYYRMFTINRKSFNPVIYKSLHLNKLQNYRLILLVAGVAV